ncbi:MAG: winged helix-turn-helix transcriptional regulator [Chloroflexi bacterium]|nr:winged helix-turn-helix transcriptional regulator [Chloroflexota bacterium]
MDEHHSRIFELQAEICKTLSDRTRLMILHELREGEVSVGQLAARLGLPQANVSRHLAILREREIVATRREGTTIFYTLADPRIALACDLVRQVLESRLSRSQALASSLASLGKAP